MKMDDNSQLPRCPSDVKIYSQQETFVLLRPSTPTWVTVTREGLSLLNLCTGALTVNEIADIMGVDSELVETHVRFLSDQGILGENEEAERPLQEELYNIWLHVTNACNLRCMFCYQSSGEPYPQELILEEITGFLSQARAFKPKKGSQTIILTGGEPLMRPDLWLICQRGSELGFKISLLTNGTLITEETAQEIKTHMERVQVSLDGMQKSNDVIRGEGSFQRTVAGISTLLDVGVMPSVAIVATRLNLGEIPELLQFLREKGITQMQVRPVMYRGRGSANQPQLALRNNEYESLITRIYEEGYGSNPDLLNTERFAGDIKTPTRNARGCFAGWYAVSIAATGEVYPCIAGHIPEFESGSIRAQPFETIWKNTERLRKWRSFDVNMSPHCGSCEWRNFCGGGCKVNAFLQHGEIDGGDYYCEAFKSLYRYTLLQEAVL